MIIGDYEVIQEIGTLFLAEHKLSRRPFALKSVSEERAKEGNFQMRTKELELLEHPHLVKMHPLSLVLGKYYLVSDCVLDPQGNTVNLSEYLSKKARPLPEQEVRSIALQIASALDYLHQKSLSHGSLKLSNVLIGKGREKIQVALSDAGVSRLIGSQRHNWAFLAPEQRRTQPPKPADAKADVFAFGVLLYYVIMGSYPEGFFELPSQRFAEYKFPWDQLLARCLNPDPEKRPVVLMPLLEASSSQPDVKVEVWKNLEKPSAEGPKPILKPQELVRPEFDADPGAVFQKETVVARFQPKPLEIKNVEPLLTEMVIIPQDNYMRGSNHGGRDEMPRHTVTLSSFAIDIHPVTNEQFARFLEAMGGEKDVNNNDIIRLRESRIKRSGGKLIIESGYGKHPVVGVTWYGAVAYAKWIGKRLPTEAEWEVAAAGKLEECLYPTGSNIERSQANFFSSDTTAVMSYPSNGYGLYDVAGNVYEWCQDWYEYHYYDVSVQEPVNPAGPHQGVYRVLRGGCWKSLKEDMRCAHRHRNNPGTVNGTYGFRCAADVV